MKKRIKCNRRLLNEIIWDRHTKRLNALMAVCDDQEFMKLFFKLAEYVVPKPKAVVSHENEPVEVNIKVKYLGPNNPI